jgi:glycosyltransferase involved in cell wall biosynthesis
MEAATSLNAVRTRFPWDRKAVKRLASFVDQHHIDIIHSHNTAARQYACLAKCRCNVGHVHTDHGSNRNLVGLVNLLRLMFMRRYTDACVAVSDEAASLLMKAEHRAEGDVATILNGIPIACDSEAAPGMSSAVLRGLWEIETPICIGYVGRLSSEKGVDRLIKSFAKLPAECTLVLAGDGPQRLYLESLALALGVSPRVRFLGAQTNARQLMHAFDLLVLPSRSEGLPLVLLEAMAERVPVAVTDVGECRRVLGGGGVGLLLPDSETIWPSILIEYLETIQCGNATAMVDYAYQQVVGNYTVERTLSEYERIYQSVYERVNRNRK